MAHWEEDTIRVTLPLLDKLEVICSEALIKNAGQSGHVNAHEVALSIPDILRALGVDLA